MWLNNSKILKTGSMRVAAQLGRNRTGEDLSHRDKVRLYYWQQGSILHSWRVLRFYQTLGNPQGLSLWPIKTSEDRWQPLFWQSEFLLKKNSLGSTPVQGISMLKRLRSSKIFWGLVKPGFSMCLPVLHSDKSPKLCAMSAHYISDLGKILSALLLWWSNDEIANLLRQLSCRAVPCAKLWPDRIIIFSERA